jgi:protein-tyrosine phosphatase
MYKFAAASTDESLVFGSARPGYTSKQVKEWIDFMQQQGIGRVCCLLSKTQIECYPDLLDLYRQFFGIECVCWEPIEDFHFVDREVLIRQILPFLAVADRQHQKVVIHCAGGIGRTGHILAAWLVAKRGFTNKLAIDIVRQTGRNPYEAVIASPFLGRNPWHVAAELNLLLDECRCYDLNSLATAINPNAPAN